MATPRLEDTPKWPEIREAALTRNLGEVAREFGVKASQLMSALRRVDAERTAVPVDASAKKKAKAAKPAKAAATPEPTPAPAAATPAAKAPEPKAEPVEQKAAPAPAPAAPADAAASDDPKVLIEAHKAELGTMPDAELAERLGVSRWTLRRVRIDLGIDAYDRHAAAREAKASSKAPRGSAQSALSELHDIIGTVPDTEIAERAGVSYRTVLRYRQRHGIPAARARTRLEAPAPEAPAVEAPRPKAKAPAPEAPKAAAPAPKPEAKAKAPEAKAKAPEAKAKAPEAKPEAKAKAPEAEAPAPGAETPEAKAKAPAPAAPEARKAAAQPAPVTRPKARGTLFAWRLTFNSGTERIAVGDTIATVATSGAASGHGELLHIERLGEALA